MKILHVFHYSNLVNGVDRTTLTLLSALRQLGVDVSALVPDPGDVTQALDELGVPYRVASLGCCTGPSKPAELAYLAHAATRAELIESWLREGDFDLIHLNTGHLLDGAIAACKANVPVIWHIHAPFEIDYERYIRFMEPAAYAWLLGELGNHVIGVSEDVRTSLLEWLPSEKISTLYNGIDVDDLDIRAQQPRKPLREELGLPANIPLVLGLGRISAQKDFATFVRVARRVADTHSSVCFVIVGPVEARELAEALPKQIKELGLDGRVFVLGARNDAPALLAQSNVFLSTAIFEGQGLAALEAMSLNKPAVAMDCVGLRECIEHEVDGLLVPLGDEDACAQAVLRVLHDDGLAEKLGQRGRQSVLDKYSAQAYAKGFLAITESVLHNTPPNNKTAVADFALGLLKKIREAHERASQLDQRAHFQTRFKNKLLQWTNYLK
ncbi:glycosyltransferase [Candidatus Nitrotoga sp. M5]|uniref:glycosyltransferase n=1 Tax=Candidatus Nitrotoga sp. M5 TaxID=2890409 RepID=UPI001EF328EF|nr:glycosyltransferase [Candidatus Nitrotoga sp. M5]CAH1386237.1 Glycosyltransferase involved in cell wall bisynthesis [Candidatus Nitrotoga sp. M5]